MKGEHDSDNGPCDASLFSVVFHGILAFHGKRDLVAHMCGNSTGRVFVFANGSVTDRWKTHILLKKLMLACKFNFAATLVTSVV